MVTIPFGGEYDAAPVPTHYKEVIKEIVDKAKTDESSKLKELEEKIQNLTMQLEASTNAANSNIERIEKVAETSSSSIASLTEHFKAYNTSQDAVNQTCKKNIEELVENAKAFQTSQIQVNSKVEKDVKAISEKQAKHYNELVSVARDNFQAMMDKLTELSGSDLGGTPKKQKGQEIP